MSKKIIVNTQDPVSLLSKPDVKFTDDFDAAIYQKAYPTWWDQLLQCPCKEKGLNSPRPTCKNCHGKGFIVANRIETKTLVQSMNASTQYKNWSMELTGTASITSLSSDKYAYMDRITLTDAEQERSQLVYPVFLATGKIIALLDYPPISITDMRVFNGDDNELVQVDASEITIGEEGELDLTNLKDILVERGSGTYTFDATTGISIRYTYRPSYHIIEATRDVIISPIDGPNKEVLRHKFPYHYIGMKSHLLFGEGNLTNLGSNYINNSIKQIRTENDFM